MNSNVLRVGLIGTGTWTQVAHLPAFERCRRAKVLAICGQNASRNEEVAKKFGIPDTYTDHHALMERGDIDIIDIATSTSRHFALAADAIETGKAILCEKPLAATYKEARILSDKAAGKGVRTKIGFTFRYSPVMLRIKELIQEGFIGVPYHFNGFEQNSQFIDPNRPFRWNPSEDPRKLMPGSLEEYAPHLIDLALWFMGDLSAVVGNLKNFIPERMIRDSSRRLPINIEDGCVWLGKFKNGAQGTFQTSFIAIGGYPGIEIRIYGSKGALIGRLIEEFGVSETLKAATVDNVEFAPVELPERLYPAGYRKDERWIQLYFGNLVQHFVDEVLGAREPDGNFVDGARSQEVATAVHASHLERRWVELPLD